MWNRLLPMGTRWMLLIASEKSSAELTNCGHRWSCIFANQRSTTPATASMGGEYARRYLAVVPTVQRQSVVRCVCVVFLNRSTGLCRRVRNLSADINYLASRIGEQGYKGGACYGIGV